MIIAMTGVSGNMGIEAFTQTLELPEVERVRILLRNTRKNRKLYRKLKRKYKSRVTAVFGNVSSFPVCNTLVKDADYVVHMAAVIPPASDASFKQSYECNLRGAVAMTDAVKAQTKKPKYIHISTVALYGNRNEKHPFGRVGDPLLVSPFDSYAMHKLYGERYVLDAGLENFAVLRQTAMLHPNMLKDNVSDGLMFHTALNSPLEWVSSRDSGYLIKRIIERDLKGEIPQFWNKIYNIGAGFKGMETGYDSFQDGFGIIGGAAEKFFRPDLLSPRNFPGMWFADGDELEKLFGYQRDGVHEYWKEIAKRHRIYGLAKIVPAKLIYLFLFKRLLNHPNAPRRWIKRGDYARVQAYFGGERGVNALPKKWDEVKLMAKGDFGDYDELRNAELAKKNGRLLSLGYDESKAPEEWTAEDMRQAAEFRGGRLLDEAETGSPYKKLRWRCHGGHEFFSSPYTVLKGGHWCPVCCQPSPWEYDRLAKHSPFFAQVWYDSHEKNENYVYEADEDGTATAVHFSDGEERE